MKKIFLSFALVAGILVFAKAQQPGDRFESWRVAYYTQKLDLSTEEAKVFWPVYDAFSAERKKIRDKMRLERMEMKINFEEMNEQEVNALLDEMINGRQAELDLYKKYISEFRKVLPAKKVALLMRVEQDFKQEIIRQLREKGQGSGPRGGGGRW